MFNQLELYPSTRSGNTIHLIVNITFESCPIGFETLNSTGECICDHGLWQYTNTCNIDRQAILRNTSSTFWLNVSYNSGTPERFIHHPFCPLDYCMYQWEQLTWMTLTSNAMSTVLACCVENVKKVLVLSWAALNAKSAVTII